MSEEQEKGLIYVPGADKPQSADDIIAGGAFDASEFATAHQNTVFLVDSSGSMHDYVNRNEAHQLRQQGKHPLEKYKLMQRALERYINKRYEEFPDSRVSLIAFESSVHTLVTYADNPRDCLNAVKLLRPMGGTNMANGLTRAISLIEKVKSSRIPRIVLISDGQPHDPGTVNQLIEDNKEKKIIIDAIYLGEGPVEQEPEVHPKERDPWYTPRRLEDYFTFMRTIADTTGGIFEHIDSEAEFEVKFLGVAERPLLGAGKPDAEQVSDKGPIIL